MRHHVKKLILLLVIFLTFTGCDSVNNPNDIYLSENRIADLALLKIKMEKIDSEISSLINSNERPGSSSPQSQKLISRNQEKIRKFKSQRDILEKEVMLLHEIEQEYQSKK
jgi:hypothetical protein